MEKKGWLVTGVLLIAMGLLFLLNRFIPESWPLGTISVGTAFIVAAVFARVGPLAIPGTTVAGIGIILFWQNLTGNWESWFYVWPLLFAFAGAGFILAHVLGLRSQKVRALGQVWLFEGVVAFFLFLLGRFAFASWFTWPFILIGLGAMLLLAVPLTRLTFQAIPGTILIGLGLLLYWQSVTGSWGSWAYLWPVIPGLVGLGLFLAGPQSKALRIAGLSIMAGALVFLAIFCLAFVPGWGPFWPLILILGGGLLLAGSLLHGRRLRPQS